MIGKVFYRRILDDNQGDIREASAELPVHFDEERDYVVCKGIIDAWHSMAVETVETKLGLREVIKRSDVLTPKAKKAAVVIERSDEVVRKLEEVVQVVEKLEEVVETAAHPLQAAAERNEPLPESVYVDHNGDVQDKPGPLALSASAPTNTSGSTDAAASAPVSTPVSLVDIDAEMDAIPREVHNDELHKKMVAYITGNGDKEGMQRRNIEGRKLRDGYATQLAAIPQERRLAFLDELAKLPS